MSELAFYHRKGWKPKAVSIVNRNEDGTVDLADADGVVVVTRCALVAAAGDLDGVATLAAVADAPKPKPGKKAKGGD